MTLGGFAVANNKIMTGIATANNTLTFFIRMNSPFASCFYVVWPEMPESIPFPLFPEESSPRHLSLGVLVAI